MARHTPPAVRLQCHARSAGHPWAFRCEPRLSSAVHIAIVDDEVDITLLLANYLQSHGFRVTQLHDGRALMRLMPADPPALVLLDLGLPGEDGFAIARQLREHWRCGLVIVTGRGDSVDKVVGLEVGADDYVTKPFDLRELVARVKAVLRRVVPAEAPALAAITREAPPETLRFAGWALDSASRRLTDPQGADVPLTTGEFDLLCAFAKHPGRELRARYKYGDSTPETAQRRIIAYRERSQVVYISAGIPRMSIHILRSGSACVTGGCHSEMSANYVIATEPIAHDSDTSPVRMPSSSAKDILPRCRHTCRYYLCACQGLSTG